MELDALADPEVDDHKDGDLNMKSSSSPDAMRPEGAVSGSSSEGAEVSSGPTSPAPATPPGEDTVRQAKAEASSPPPLERKVRFSEELIHGAQARPSTGDQNSPRSDTRGPSSLKASSPSKIKHVIRGPKQAPESVKDHVGGPPDQGDIPAPVAQPQSSSEHRAPSQQQASEVPVVSETEWSVKDSVPPAIPNSTPAGKACASLQENSVQPVEHPKSNIRNTGVP